jgi:selenocysteine-specific translation elongation factor
MSSTQNHLKRSLLIATAGHIDHGKSTFIKTLTGTDPDRLPEEKKRGMTLDLGFAFTTDISFIDCPGHDGLIKHMIAGNISVDGVCLVVSLTEGVCEQTREHINVLKWLGVKKVLVILSKTDLIAEKEERDFKQEIIFSEISLLLNAVETDWFFFSRNDQPSEVLKKIKYFFRTPTNLNSMDLAPARFFYDRFFIDRAFSIKGTGTVVTGTFFEGTIKAGDTCLLFFPHSKRPRQVKVKEIRHQKAQALVQSDFSRVAFALDDVKPPEINRGTVLISGQKNPILSQSLLLEIDFIIPTKSKVSLTLQLGTLSVQAKLRHHRCGIWRAWLEFPSPVRRGDRVIIRQPHRSENVGHCVGGAVVLDAFAPQVKIQSAPPRDDLAFIKWARLHGMLKSASLNDWALRLGWTKEKITNTAEFTFLNEKRENLIQIPTKNIELNNILLSEIKNLKWQAVVEERQLDDCHALVRSGELILIKENHFLHKDYYLELIKWLNSHFEIHEDLSIDHSRSFLGVSRQYILNLLEYSDRQKWTFRKGLTRKAFKLPLMS